MQVMLSKTLWVFAFVCVVQRVIGRPPENPTKPSPIQEAIQRINPVLDKITLKLKELKLEIHKSQLQAITETHGSISNSGGKVLAAVNQLQLNISEISETVNKSNINIEPCLCRQRAKLERVLIVANSKIMKTSDESELQSNNFTEKANALVEEADNIDKNLNKVIGYCIRQNNLAWQQEKLTECLFNEASYVNKIVDELYDRKNLMENERNKFNNNITSNHDNLLKWVSSLQGEFLKCVSESEPYSKDTKTSQEVKDLASEDTKISHKPDKITNQDSSESNETMQINLDQQLKSTEGQFDQPQRISQRIQRLEVMLDRLKQLHQLKETQNSEKTPLSPKEGEFRPNQPITTPNQWDLNKKEKSEPSGENRRFILYISF